MKAWHFVGQMLLDRRPVPRDGVKLIHNGELEMCAAGFHASTRIIDALDYAPGTTICRVEVGGKIIKGNDKLVSFERTILWRIKGDEVLRKFARMCALDVVHLWGAPEVVVQFLRTGDESLQHSARRDAAWDAAGAARAAAWDAAQAAAGAARAAAWDAAQAAAGAARAAARAAADAAGPAVREKQNRRLHRMVMEAHRVEETGAKMGRDVRGLFL